MPDFAAMDVPLEIWEALFLQRRFGLDPARLMFGHYLVETGRISDWEVKHGSSEVRSMRREGCEPAALSGLGSGAVWHRCPICHGKGYLTRETEPVERQEVIMKTVQRMD